MGYRKDFFDDPKNKTKSGLYTCFRCHKKFKKEDIDVDHIIPQSLGGDDGLDNLQCMCKHCNRSKRDNIDDTLDDLKDNAYRRLSLKEKREINNAVHNMSLKEFQKYVWGKK